ncbi:MAG: hypothetical protein U1D30_23485 [Planctomycetota bacterium]
MANRVPVEPVLRLTREALTRAGERGVFRVVGARQPVRCVTEEPTSVLCMPEVSGPFHFTRFMSILCNDITRRMDVFRHIDMQRILVTFVRSRNPRIHGLQAKLVPLRCRNGALTEERRGYEYKVQRFFVGEVELHYVLSFYLPRFLNQSFDEKMITIFHELYHVGPNFCGDIRRFDGTRSVHNRSQREYDRHMAELVKMYLACKPPRMLYDFLKLNFQDLQRRYGEVVGVSVPSPKLIPVSKITKPAS